MEIKILNSFHDDLQPAWDALLQTSAVNVPFLKYGYLKLWWQSLGGGEWKSGEPYIILGYEQKELIGIAPLFRTIRDGKTLFTFIGSKEISDYLDLIVSFEHADSFFDAVIHHLIDEVPDLWDQIEFTNIHFSSLFLHYFQNISLSKSVSCNIEKDQPAPYFILSGNWDTYLESLDKKQRHEIRRKIRRVEQESVNYRFFFVDDEKDLQKSGELFLGLMQEDPAKKIFLTPSMLTHMQSLLSWGFTECILKLCFLEINGVLSAGYLCFDDQKTIYIYNSGIHTELQYFSPGWVLLSYLIQWAIENSRIVIDFMRGNESYKYKFGAVDSFSFVYKISLSKKKTS
ncbi:MAG: GNAT family N-acetyltransferase [Anaerolineaceae bacterium]